MYAIIVVLLLAGQDCDSWFNRFFTIECATGERRMSQRPDEPAHLPDNGDKDKPDKPDKPDVPDKPDTPDTPSTPEPPEPSHPVAGDPNKGHGNDEGRHDPDNPGQGHGEGHGEGKGHKEK